jgi:beta-lactamase superfamily II metal-dependent hydrolase
MPFFDKSIDAIIITNPDQDHIGGFSDILKSYEVGAIFEPGTVSSSKTYQNLERFVIEDFLRLFYITFLPTN